jgi:hypothetical protein
MSKYLRALHRRDTYSNTDSDPYSNSNSNSDTYTNPNSDPYSDPNSYRTLPIWRGTFLRKSMYGCGRN